MDHVFNANTFWLRSWDFFSTHLHLLGYENVGQGKLRVRIGKTLLSWGEGASDRPVWFDLVWRSSYRGLATVLVELSDPASLKVVLSLWLPHHLGHGERGQRVLQGAVRPPAQPSALDQPAAAPMCAPGCLPGDWQPRWQCGGAQGVSPGEDVSAAFQVRGGVGTLGLWRSPPLTVSGTWGRDQSLARRMCLFSGVLVFVHSRNKNSVATFSGEGLLPLSWNFPCSPLPTILVQLFFSSTLEGGPPTEWAPPDHEPKGFSWTSMLFSKNNTVCFLLSK